MPADQSNSNITPACSSAEISHLQRFQQLESDIRHYQQLSHGQNLNIKTEWLNEYIDLGLNMAQQAESANRTQLQESWLKRVYNTLFETALDLVQPDQWRNLCRDYLYQPLFALQHLYRSQPNGDRRIRALYHELSVTSRYLF